MSPKHSSLAFDEVADQSIISFQDDSFEPELNLLITRSMMADSSSSVETIGGRVTVSF